MRRRFLLTSVLWQRPQQVILNAAQQDKQLFERPGTEKAKKEGHKKGGPDVCSWCVVFTKLELFFSKSKSVCITMSVCKTGCWCKGMYKS